MKLVKRRIFTSILVCFMACIMFYMPVFAASFSVSKNIRLTTYKKTSFSFGSIAGGDIQITQVEISTRMSSGSARPPFVCLESPSGTVIKFGLSATNSVTYSTNGFNGENPKGTWYAWIETDETVSIQNVTVNVKVTYSY